MKNDKQQINSRIPRYLVNEMKAQAQKRGTTESSIVEAALKMIFNETERDHIIDRRLNKLQKQIERLTKEQQLTLETLATFIKVYLVHTPEIPLERKTEREDQAGPRFENVVRSISKGLSRKQMFRNSIDEQILSEADFEALQ